MGFIYFLLVVLFLLYFQLAKDIKNKEKFSPFEFRINLNIFKILEKAGFKKDTIKKIYGVKSDSGEYGYWEEIGKATEGKIFSPEGINYYFNKYISYSVINQKDGDYLMYNSDQKFFQTSLTRRIYLNPNEGFKSKNTDFDSVIYPTLYIRDSWINKAKCIEIGLIKNTSTLDSGESINFWEDCFKDHDNYLVLGAIPYNFLDLTWFDNKIINQRNNEILGKYELKRDSYWNEYWNTTEVWLENEFIKVYHGSIE
ncbi:hypothetical protein KBB89_00910 [Candidatus Gracilibacteria bacterium]|nr:hypothetical protein [Candidatus Gracilibacteria bacterium]